MSGTHPVYVPAGSWLVATLTAYCSANGVGNAEVTGIGSLTNVWVLVNPDGTLVVKNYDAGSYELTSLVGNVTVRQGVAVFEPSWLPSGAYPRFDPSVPTYNPYLHVHATFAQPDQTIAGGHLLDAQVSIGAEVFLRETGATCVPPVAAPVPDGCISSVPVTVEPYGTFANWDERFWFPPAGG